MLYRLLPLFRFMKFGATYLHCVYETLSFIYRTLWRFSLFRVFQRLSLYDLTGFFIIQFCIQLFCRPFVIVFTTLLGR